MPSIPTTQEVPLTPATPNHTRRDSVTSDIMAEMTTSDQMRIQRILCHELPDKQNNESVSPPPTPASTSNDSTQSYTPFPDTPDSATPNVPPSRRQKTGKDGGLTSPKAPQNPVNYEPTECNAPSLILTFAQRAELTEQHKRFRLSPFDLPRDKIRDFPKHIPYTSEKKGFFEKTGREAFEVFQYTFVVPEDPDHKLYTVMWDYQIGLVRITPCFKACGFSKTTPAKALSTNPGLKELCHSITGGALIAQGYWVPFDCARAICLTFCHPIRWALTPVFGHSFVKDCLPPDHADYKRFKISADIVRKAQSEADTWKSQASRSVTPATEATYNAGGYPASLPPTSAPASGHDMRPRRDKPAFKLGSPFTQDTKKGYHRQLKDGFVNGDFALSPKSSPSAIYARANTGWTSINGSPSSSSAYQQNDPTESSTHPLKLLTTSRTLPNSPCNSWRDQDGRRSPSPAPNGMPLQKAAMGRYYTRKRPTSEREGDLDSATITDSSSTDGKTSNMDASPLPALPKKRARRAHRVPSYKEEASESSGDDEPAVNDDTMTNASFDTQSAAQVLFDLCRGEFGGRSQA